MSLPNRLSREKSPYLLQHQFNPVDWYPWGEEAFAKARAEQKPIFLSVGYATCHWCHVMARECFENPEIAELMNRYFVNIKVDREERPDVDKVYMTALQAMGENGGWPMSMFLTPDLKPFFGGTYFPPVSRYGRISFPDLLQRLHDVWVNQQTTVMESAAQIAAHLKQMQGESPSGVALDRSLSDRCFDQAARSFDPQHGGFGGGPKFPRPSVFNFLLRYYHSSGEGQALEMCDKTLKAMASGGMYDHVGGGFHRYSVDAEWRVPHFEKMLYDQAQIACSLADMVQLTGEPFYRRILRETLHYVLRDLTSPEGGFYSAEDADSPLPESPNEHGEGAFYIWSKREIDDLLGDDARVFNFHYGVEPDGNALHDPQMEFAGKNILYIANSLKDTAAYGGMSEEEAAALLTRSKRKLLEVRSARPRPLVDDKILVAWNGLMISAFSRAAQALNEPAYRDAGSRAADFLLTHLYDESSGTLNRRYRQREAGLEAHLDDYAFLTQGLLDLYEVEFDPGRLTTALRLQHKAIELFSDQERGGFFDTSGRDESILVRMKEQYDGAEPTGNAITAMNLLRLAHITGDMKLRELAERTFAAFAETFTKSPFAMPQMAATFDFSTSHVKQIVVAGRKGDDATEEMIREIFAHYLPNKILLLAKEDMDVAGEFVKSLKMLDGKATAYVCENFVCRLPTTDVGTLRSLLLES